MDVKESMRAILRAESKAILNIPVTDNYEKAVDIIVERILIYGYSGSQSSSE